MGISFLLFWEDPVSLREEVKAITENLLFFLSLAFSPLCVILDLLHKYSSQSLESTLLKSSSIFCFHEANQVPPLDANLIWNPHPRSLKNHFLLPLQAFLLDPRALSKGDVRTLSHPYSCLLWGQCWPVPGLEAPCCISPCPSLPA